jgi:hypothetical protein
MGYCYSKEKIKFSFYFLNFTMTFGLSGPFCEKRT